MWGLLLPVVVAIGVTVLLVKVLEPLAWRIGWLDKPDARKQHGDAVPLTGGVAIFGGFVAALLAAGELALHWPLVTAMGLLCLVGLLDDYLDLPAMARLLLQVVVSLGVCIWQGLHLCHLGDLFGFGPIHLPEWLGTALVVFCIVGVINAINMIDGVDGLAAGLLVMALLWLAVLAVQAGNDELLVLMLAGSLAGYLCFNMRGPLRGRASVFMGDAGSTMLGFVVTWLLLIYSRNEYTEVHEFPPVVVLWLLAVPLLDIACLIISRGLRGHSPFRADRDHIHHILQRAGLADRQVTIVIIMVSYLCGGVGVAGWLLHWPDWVLAYGFLLLFAAYYWAVHHKGTVARWLARWA